MGPGSLLRVRYEAEVRQAPAADSALLHTAQPGRTVKQLAAARNGRVPLVPRGWIDEAAVEPAGGEEAAPPRQAAAPAAKEPAATAATPAAATTGLSLLMQLADDRGLSVPKGGRQEEAADTWAKPKVPPDDPNLEVEGKFEKGQRVEAKFGVSFFDAEVVSIVDESNLVVKYAYDGSEAELPTASVRHKVANVRHKVEGEGSDWKQAAPQTGTAGLAQAQDAPAAAATAPGGDWWTTSGDQQQQDVDPGVTASALFSGSVRRLDDRKNEAEVECHEAKAIFGSGDLRIARALLPPGCELGSVLGFNLRGGAPGGAPLAEPGTVLLVDAESGHKGVLAGTLKSFAPKQGGERVGYLASAFTDRRYGCDVYVHGSMLGDMTVGTAVGFSVHENSRGLPQAARGSVVQIGPTCVAADRGAGDGVSAGMDAAAYAPGRVMFGLDPSGIFDQA